MAACVLSCLVVAFTGDLEKLAELYAIGVIGAITINLGLCTLDRSLLVHPLERIGLGLMACILLLIELTIVVTKPHATLFAGSVVVGGLILRAVAAEIRARRAPAIAEAELPEEERVSILATLQQRCGPIKTDAARVMVAIRGPTRLMDFALDYARMKKATLFAITVREMAVPIGEQVTAPGLDEDSESIRLFETLMERGKKMGVQVYPIYAASTDAADVILDFAVSYHVSTVLMGVSRRLAVVRALRGNIIRAIAGRLPEKIDLLIHAG